MIKKDNRGITLIELLIGVTVLAVVGTMVMQLMTSSTRMYHSTITYADIQTESQSVSRRLSKAIMEAEVIGMEKGDKGTCLFAGKREGGVYGGTAFWYNSETGCLYQNSSFSVDTSGAAGAKGEGGGKEGTDKAREDAAEGIGTEKDAPIDMDTISAALDGKREYLISDKVAELDFTIPEEDGKKGRTIHYDIVFHFLDSKTYPVTSSVTPRNWELEGWWKKDERSKD